MFTQKINFRFIDFTEELKYLTTTGNYHTKISMAKLTVKITIICACWSLAADFWGISDSYVIFKTKWIDTQKTIVYNSSLNQYLNEIFKCKIEGGETITFNVFDSDKIGKDDSLGKIQWLYPPIYQRKLV